MFTIKYKCKEEDKIRLQKMLENNEFDKFHYCKGVGKKCMSL